jgi:hypothetical protein
MDRIRYWTRWLRPSWHRQADAAERLAAVRAKGEAAAEAAGREYDKDGDPAYQEVVAEYVAAERTRAGMPADADHERIGRGPA